MSDMAINFLGRDEDGLLLAEVVVNDAEILRHIAELERRGDTEHHWIELMLGPAGMVEAEGHERFRVMRVIGYPSDEVYVP